jgi:hypothetical protein
VHQGVESRRYDEREWGIVDQERHPAFQQGQDDAVGALGYLHLREEGSPPVFDHLPQRAGGGEPVQPDAGQPAAQLSEHFAAFEPYASRHPFETWILPLRHGPDFESITDAERYDLAGLLISVLGRLEKVLPRPAYNLFLYSGPNRKTNPDRWRTLAADFHWHIEILPRLFYEAGFEMGSGLYGNACRS